MSIDLDGIKGVIASAVETKRELEFQAQRLNRAHANTTVDEEAEHLLDLAEKYAEAARVVGVLLNYQRGRLRQFTGRGLPYQGDEEE